MSTQQNLKGFFTENKGLLKEYADLRLRLIKLQGVKIISRSLSLLIVIFIFSIMSMFILLFLGMSFAWWLSDLTNSPALGFLGAAAMLVLVLALTIMLRKPLFQSPLIRMFIRETTKDFHAKED